jgi:hypothetical protein
MKKLLIILLSLGLTFGASAQKRVGVHHGYVRPRVTVIAPVYPYYGYGYGYGYSPFYNPLYDPFYAQNRFQSERPSKLDLQLEDIQNDYQYQISTVRHDKNLARQERKQKIRDLKHQREDAVVQAKKNYYSRSDNNS